MQRYYDQFENCREHDIPYCGDACPFKVDVLDLQEKMSRNRYNTAYKVLRNSVVFPEIVAALCPGYCEKACIRSKIDSAVQINMLEKTAMAKATRKKANEYNLPAKKGRIAVIGAGISGMGFTFRLASKKYDVTVYEKSDKPGGHLWDVLDDEVFINDFDRQFQYEEYSLKTNTEITDLSDLASENYDVIYVATGKGGNDFGLLECSAEDGSSAFCRLEGDSAVFAGGSLCGKDTMCALADGLDISRAAEIYLKIRKLEYPAAAAPTQVVANEKLLHETPAVIPGDADGTFTDEQAVEEAGRCIRCQCDGCRQYCDIVGYFDKWPIIMRDEILLTSKPSKSLVHKNPAMRYINSCTQCGLFSETCPGNIDLCDMIKSARRKIHTLDKTPGAFRQYWLRDMAFANSDFAAVKKSAPGKSGCSYAFFPGCNLGALDPDYVLEPYKWLLSQRPDTGLLLRCCSVPVDWNGEETVHNEEIEKLRTDWDEMGRPKLIMACMSCAKHLREYLPEIELVSLYEVMDQWGFMADQCRETSDIGSDTAFAVFDPCSARNDEPVQAAVRNLAVTAGLNIKELPEGDRHGCCGFGGLGSVASPGFSQYVAARRCSLSNDPYLVYCSNCRDVFTDNGKPAIHILDALFHINENNAKPEPTVTERRDNRAALKEKLLNEIWHEEMKMKPEKNKYDLKISDKIRDKMNKQRLLEKDICEVIEYSEKTGRRTVDPSSGHYKAYREIGYITCWVEYGITDNLYEIYNVYSHRMRIELEVVFNGKKIDE